MLILWIYFGSGTRGLLTVDIGEVQHKLGGGDHSENLRASEDLPQTRDLASVNGRMKIIFGHVKDLTL